MNFGTTFLEAVKDRYGIIDDDNAGVITEELYVRGKNQQTVVEMVGAKSVNLQQRLVQAQGFRNLEKSLN